MEMTLYPEDLETMDECFVTNSLMGIMPVTQFGTQKYEIGPVTQSCMGLYEKNR